MKESNVIKTLKNVATIVGGIGVGAIIGNAVKHVSPTNSSGLLMKACVGFGTMLLGGLACDATAKYADRQIDEAAEFVENMVKDSEDELKEKYAHMEDEFVEG